MAVTLIVGVVGAAIALGKAVSGGVEAKNARLAAGRQGIYALQAEKQQQENTTDQLLAQRRREEIANSMTMVASSYIGADMAKQTQIINAQQKQATNFMLIAVGGTIAILALFLLLNPGHHNSGMPPNAAAA
jgi:bifunctional ADP-heptose synthase (sugar kinase/adenylyltransferase)